MQRMSFPGFLDHKADHQRLLQDAADFMETIGGALGDEDTAAIASYFKYWLVRHMADKDGTLKLYLKSRDRVQPE